MRPSKKLIAIALTASMAWTPPVFAGAADGGSLEITQIISWLTNELEWLEQLRAMGQQYAALRDSLDVQKLMNQQLGDVTGLVRDVSDMRQTTQEISDMKGDITSALGALDTLRSSSEERYKEMSNYRDQFGNRKTAQDFFLQSIRNNAGEHKMNNILRDQEVAAVKRLESTSKSVQEHASKIPQTKGVHEAVSLMSTQVNGMVALIADANKVIFSKSLRDTQRDDTALADRQRAAAEQKRLSEANQSHLDDQLRLLKAPR